jgi:hypothetical protein
MHVDPLYYFIDIDNTDEILQINKHLEECCMYGAVCLNYYDQIIIDFIHYDLMYNLWTDILLMIEKYIEPQQYDWCVQTQPMSIKNISHHGHILFSINSVQWKLPKYEFLDTILYGAEYFFKKIIFLLGETSYLVELKRINLLQQHINALKRSNT